MGGTNSTKDTPVTPHEARRTLIRSIQLLVFISTLSLAGILISYFTVVSRSSVVASAASLLETQIDTLMDSIRDGPILSAQTTLNNEYGEVILKRLDLSSTSTDANRTEVEQHVAYTVSSTPSVSMMMWATTTYTAGGSVYYNDDDNLSDFDLHILRFDSADSQLQSLKVDQTTYLPEDENVFTVLESKYIPEEQDFYTYSIVEEEGTSRWVEPIIQDVNNPHTPSGELGLDFTLAKLIQKSDENIVAMCVVTSQTLSDFLLAARPTPDSSMALVSDTAVVVASTVIDPDDLPDFEVEQGGEVRVVSSKPLSKYSDTGLRVAGQLLEARSQSWMQLTRKVSERGDGYLVHTSTLSEGGLQWTLVLAVPEDEFVVDLNRATLYSLLLSAVILAAFVMVASFLTTYFSAPLLKVAEDAHTALDTKNALVRNSHHELMTPVSCIHGLANMLSDTSGLDPYQQGLLRKMLGSTTHLTALVRDLLEMSVLGESQELNLQPFPTNLRTVLEESVATASQRCYVHGVRIGLRMGLASPPLYLLDPMRIRQVCINILGNAAKFTESGNIECVAECVPTQCGGCGHPAAIPSTSSSEAFSGLDVGAGCLPTVCEWCGARVDYEAVLSFRDTGCGIPDADIKNIFRAFYRVKGQAMKIGGTGLGLSITKKIADRMGGILNANSIHVADVDQGTPTGTEFLLRFAVESVPYSAERDSSGALAGLSPGRGITPSESTTGEFALGVTAANDNSGEDLHKMVGDQPPVPPVCLRGRDVLVAVPPHLDRRLLVFYLREAGARVSLLSDPQFGNVVAADELITSGDPNFQSAHMVGGFRSGSIGEGVSSSHRLMAGGMKHNPSIVVDPPPITGLVSLDAPPPPPVGGSVVDLEFSSSVSPRQVELSEVELPMSRGPSQSELRASSSSQNVTTKSMCAAILCSAGDTGADMSRFTLGGAPLPTVMAPVPPAFPWVAQDETSTLESGLPVLIHGVHTIPQDALIVVSDGRYVQNGSFVVPEWEEGETAPRSGLGVEHHGVGNSTLLLAPMVMTDDIAVPNMVILPVCATQVYSAVEKALGANPALGFPWEDGRNVDDHLSASDTEGGPDTGSVFASQVGGHLTSPVSDEASIGSSESSGGGAGVESGGGVAATSGSLLTAAGAVSPSPRGSIAASSTIPKGTDGGPAAAAVAPKKRSLQMVLQEKRRKKAKAAAMERDNASASSGALGYGRGSSGTLSTGNSNPNGSDGGSGSEQQGALWKNKKALKRTKFSDMKVLVVDDEEINRMVVRRYLGKFGVSNIGSLESGEAAVASVLQGDPVDVIFMDINMSGEMDGLDATRTIREAAACDPSHPGRKVYICGLSGHSAAEESPRAEAAGMDAYESKPILPTRVEHHLEMAYTAKK